MIIFEERGKVDGEETMKGTVFMSIYRRQTMGEGSKIATKILYDKIKEKITLLHERYSNLKIILGGDYNDPSSPESL